MLSFSRGRAFQGPALFIKENLSFVILLVSAILLQMFLRFSNLDFHGLWRDEAATLYFSRFPSEVLTGDSHTIFYYLLMSLAPADYLREFHGIVSFVLFLCILRVSWKALPTYPWFFFNSIYGLHPLVFGFNRLARPYGWMIDLTAILIFLGMNHASRKKVFFVTLALSSIHPFGIIPPVFEVLMKRVSWKPVAAGIAPVIVYYVIKVLVDHTPTAYVSWIHVDFTTFFLKVNGMLAGSFFPTYQNGPGVAEILFLALGFFGSLFARDKAFFFSFVLLYSAVLLLPNFLAPLQDLRIERYYIFLFPYFLLSMAAALPGNFPAAFSATAFMVFLLLIQVTVTHPFFQHRYSLGGLADLAKTLAKNNEVPVVGCGYVFHNWYFESQGMYSCEDRSLAEKMQGKAFVLAYISGRTSFLYQFMKSSDVELLEKEPDGTIVLVRPRR
jgi:hypothetical protein